jgi:hypothetical protein
MVKQICSGLCRGASEGDWATAGPTVTGAAGATAAAVAAAIIGRRAAVIAAAIA